MRPQEAFLHAARLCNSYKKWPTDPSAPWPEFPEYGPGNCYAVRKVEQDRLPVAICCAEVEGNVVPRAGDALLGFVGRGDGPVEVAVGEVEMCTLQLKEGQFQYAIDGRFALPLIVPYISYKLVWARTQPGAPAPLAVFALFRDREVRDELRRDDGFLIATHLKYPLDLKIA